MSKKMVEPFVVWRAHVLSGNIEKLEVVGETEHYYTREYKSTNYWTKEVKIRRERLAKSTGYYKTFATWQEAHEFVALVYERKVVDYGRALKQAQGALEAIRKAEPEQDFNAPRW